MEPRQRAEGEQQYEFRLGEDAGRRRHAARARQPAPRRAAKSATAKRKHHAVKAKPLFLPPEATADEAFRLTLTHCRWHILANLPAVTEAREAEGVHQLRVALRRLRVALAAFGHDFRTPAVEALRMRAKLLADGLGAARDMDVFLDELLAPAEADTRTPAAFAALRERAEARRQEAWTQALREASGLAFHTFLADLSEMIDQRQWRPAAGTTTEPHPVFDAPIKDLATAQLAHRFRAAKKRAKRLDALNESERHQLRIALKKLRYGVEFFAGLYPARAVKAFAKRLAQLQDIFGLLQDVAVARSTVNALVDAPAASLLATNGEIAFAAGTVYGWHLERANEAWSEARTRWKRIAKTTPFWETD